MKQLVSEDFILEDDTKHPLVFVNEKGHKIRVFILTDHIIRVLHTIHQQEEENYISNQQKKEDNNKNQCSFQILYQDKEKKKKIEIITLELKIIIHLSPFGITWQPSSPLSNEKENHWFAKDLMYRSYCYDDQLGTKWHYQVKKQFTSFYGLGERTGDLDLSGRHFRLERYDSMGYDAQNQDPLYKFCPFYLGLSKYEQDENEEEKWLAYGIYYNNFSRTSIDFGQEKDAMWGDYIYYQVEKGPIDYYMIYGGESISKVTQSFGKLMGGYTLMPKNMFGYLASSMGYAEREDAQEQLELFIIKCRDTYQIPCDGMHLSSGYTVQSDTGDRCVFTWNQKRFPHPIQLAKKYKEAGMKIIANVKPWLLETHPDYELLKSKHGFIWESLSDKENNNNNNNKGQPGTIWQWRAGANTKGKASYIDFTSNEGYHYWQTKIKESLLDLGYDLWLDNNEFTMIDDTQTYQCEKKCHHYPSFPIIPYSPSLNHVDTPIQTLLMIQASYEMVQSLYPNKRTCLITRSTVPFCQSLVSQTWSGDNFTEWKTLAYNIPMGTGASLSAIPAGYGHDVGGFAGPAPNEEQLVRWVQQGVFWTRFCIHSYNSDQTITEPWMYPNVLPVIRSSIEWRYKWLPHLYGLYLTLTYKNNEPVIRPTFYDHSYDVKTHQQNFEFMIGSQFLIAPIYEEGKKERQVYLPKLKKSQHSKGWYHYQTKSYYGDHGGYQINVPSTLKDSLSPLFIKDGSFMLFGKLMPFIHALPDNERYLHIYPPPSNSTSMNEMIRYTFKYIDDDGETILHESENQYMEIDFWMECFHDKIMIGYDVLFNGYIPLYDTIWVTCPLENETRPIIFKNHDDRIMIQSDHIDGHLYTYQGLKLLLN